MVHYNYKVYEVFKHYRVGEMFLKNFILSRDGPEKGTETGQR